MVEGPSDISAVRRAVDAELVPTGGFAISADTLARLRLARDRCGVIVLTDPDHVGDQIRRRLERALGSCKHAFVDRAQCTRDGDVGVEHASPEVIRAALAAARCVRIAATQEFTALDLAVYGLDGCANASARRDAVGRALGLGHGSARQMLRRLNHFAIGRDELEEALATLGAFG